MKIEVQYIESEHNIQVRLERLLDEVDEDIEDWYDSEFVMPHLDDERINDF